MLEVYRSSRLERLADLLLVKLAASAPTLPLMPQTIVVGHLGMKRWLMRHLAERTLVDGRPGIAANLQLQLPGEWLDQLAQSRLGEQLNADPYQRANLRWRIFALLPDLEQEQIQRYLSGQQSAQRRFQLADRLASLYVQYAVYRADWLAAWEQQRTASTIGSHWQGRLWRMLREGIGRPHRATRSSALQSQLAHQPISPDPLHVFGVNHLPPDVLQTLLTVSARQPVMLYFPDPCREIWEDLRQRAATLTGALPDSEFHSNHRLLAALGKLGQQFTVLLNANAEQIDDRRDALDQEAQAVSAAAPLLTRLQHSIRTLQPQLSPQSEEHGRSDASLRVHRCHTRLRELEALRDAVYDFLSAHPDAEARDVVVMAPDINQYAPFLAAVLGSAGRHQGPLPYHLADLPLRRSHPLLHAFAELLELPQQRLGRSQVLAMLDLPAVARRLGLDPSDSEALTRWLDRAEVAWGLDGRMKAEFGAAAIEQNSFAFGLQRMLAGYLIGDEQPLPLLDEEIVPALPPQGPAVDALGALDQLLTILQGMRQGMSEQRHVSDWVSWLSQATGALFEAAPDDADERAALRSIRGSIDQLRTQVQSAEVDPLVPWPVIAEALLEVLDGVPQRQPFLVGGMTVCGMVPQRAIPFRMVCVLGLNDGEFPRNRSDSGLDLLRSHPRLGDRDTRSDDRYLFLEALLSARDRLHLSYLGEGVQDGKVRNPAAPLAELLQFLDQPHQHQSQPPWIVSPPLQPFDHRYYDGADPRLHSYDGSWLAAAGPTNQSDPGAGFRAGLGEGPAKPDQPAELREVLRWYRDPARWFCQNTLNLDLRALEQSAADDREPLEIRREPMERLTRELVWRALDADSEEIAAVIPPDLAHSGRLPAGTLGRRSYALERSVAQQTLKLLRETPPFKISASERVVEAQQIDLQITGITLRGEIGRIYRVGDRRYLVELCTGEISFRQLLPLFIQMAALRLSLPEGSMVRGLLVAPSELSRLPDQFPADHQQLRERLTRLLLLWFRGHSRPPAYFPKSSWRYVDSKYQLSKAQAALTSSFFSTGELDYAPGFARLLFGELNLFDRENPDSAAFDRCARMLERIIQPGGSQ